MRQTLKYTICFLSFMLVASVVILTALFRAEMYTRALENAGEGGQEFFITSLNPAQEQATRDYLLKQTTELQVVLVRTDDQFSPVDGGSSGSHWGVYADPAALGSAPQPTYLGTTIFTSDDLSSLLEADAGKTLGLHKVQEDMLRPLPEVAFGQSFSLGKLTDLIEESGTLNGRYFMYGLSPEEFESFIHGLSQVSGISSERLIASLSGSARDGGILPLAMLAITAALTILLAITLLTYLTQGVKELGTYLLLGWSKKTYLLRQVRPLVLCLPFALLASVLVSWGMFTGFQVNLQLFLQLLAPFCIAICLMLLSLALASTVILGMRPLHAVKGYTPQKVLLLLLAATFGLLNIGVYSAAVYLDAPLKEVSRLAALDKSWEQAGQETMLYSHQVGADAASFSGQSVEYAEDTYRWYSAIETEAGVSLVNTKYISQENIDTWKNLGLKTPEKPLWYMAASPSYLESQGVDMPQEAVDRAQAGQRVYLVPHNIERSSVEPWLVEEATSRGQAEQSINTVFTRQGEIYFADYRPPQEGLFTWDAELEDDFRSQDVVIYLATTANMTYFETESLAASGLANSYIKLSPSAAELYTAPSFLARFNLDDNQPVYIPTANFVAGLQKDLNRFLQLFGVLALGIVLMTLVCLVAMTSLYANINSYKIAVRNFLGQPSVLSFRAAFLLVACINLLGLLVMLLLASRAGIILAPALLIIEFALLYYLARKFSQTSSLKIIKES